MERYSKGRRPLSPAPLHDVIFEVERNQKHRMAVAPDESPVIIRMGTFEPGSPEEMAAEKHLAASFRRVR